MKRLGSALLYTALLALANPAVADVDAARAAATGDMKKLVFHAAPKPVSDAGFISFEGDPLTLSEWEGKWLVLNFWATWCAPCRKEMPMLADLQAERGGEGFEVLTIATSRNPPAKMKAFFDEIGVENLPLHRDPNSAMARQLGVLGLPVTLIISPEGEEVARLTGDADWSSDATRAVLDALAGAEG
ncbi:TlpA disulfide reductase family protein [Pseudoponticoccus marisrubri]|uniref:Redoxin n=1 Tax=Pseudoponticoccus marisrubri TaxID=1685382 RepID=A0A0W7WJG8_9RHOB|nr:TlpA disulfide reductase family protein [Pseudoponticoccus marisrubri]KUF10698.1 redoxin [Pseudoponticoccus marisrubri]